MAQILADFRHTDQSPVCTLNNGDLDTGLLSVLKPDPGT